MISNVYNLTNLACDGEPRVYKVGLQPNQSDDFDFEAKLDPRFRYLYRIRNSLCGCKTRRMSNRWDDETSEIHFEIISQSIGTVQRNGAAPL